MMRKAPNAVSYAALLVVINNRLNLPRTLQEQRYFIDLAHDLIRLYWEYDARPNGDSGHRKAA